MERKARPKKAMEGGEMKTDICPVCGASCKLFICLACEGSLVRTSNNDFKRLRALHWSEPKILRERLQMVCIAAAKALRAQNGTAERGEA